MEKKEKVISIFLIIGAIIFLSVIAIGPGDILPAFREASMIGTCDGSTGTIASIDETTFKSSASRLNGEEAWLVEFRGIDSAQCLWGQFQGEEVSDGEKKAKEGFSLGISTTDRNCVYDYGTKRNMPIVEVDYKTYRAAVGGNAKRICKNKLNNALGGVYYDSVYPAHIVCYYATDSHEVHSISSQVEYEWKAEAKLKSDKTGEEYTTTISSEDTSSSIGTDWKALKSGWKKGGLIRWSGNLIGNYRCPDSSGYLIKDKSETISQHYYERYWDYLRSSGTLSWEQCLQEAEATTITKSVPQKVKDCKNEINNYAQKAGGHKPFCSSPGECESVDSNQIKVKADFIIPTFSLMIKADVLGIYQGVGEPKIVSFSISDFTGDEKGHGEAVVKNKGDARGSFDVWVKCSDEGIYSSTPSKRVGLDSGEEKQLTLDIGAGLDSSTDSCCTLNMEETTSGAKDTMKRCFTYSPDSHGGVKCYESPTVKIGDTKCFKDESTRTWGECQSNGNWYKSTCELEEHCEMVDGQAQCVTGGATCGDGVCNTQNGENEDNCPKDCQPWYKQYWWVIGIVVALAFGLFYYYKAGGEKGWTPPKRAWRRSRYTPPYRRRTGRYGGKY